MTSPRIRTGHRFLLALAVLMMGSGAVTSALPAVSAQDRFSQPVDIPLPADPGMFMSLYRDTSISPDQRIGNCCVPYDFSDPLKDTSYRADSNRVECFWGVGLSETDPARQIEACKNIGGIPGNGIHYNRDKWALCNVQCEDLQDLDYCNPSTLQCTSDKRTLNPADVAAGRVRVFVDRDTCDRQCVAQVDLEVTIGGACAEGKNTYTVIVREAIDAANPDAPAREATLQSITVRLQTPGPSPVALTVSDGRSHQADGTLYNAYGAQTSGNPVTEVEYAPPASRSGPTPAPIIIPAGGQFEAQIEVPALPEDITATLEARIQSNTDPNGGNNYLGSGPLAAARDCGGLTMTQACSVVEPDSTPILSHVYVHALDPASRAVSQETRIRYILDACHAWPSAAVETPVSGCTVNGGPNQPSATIDCVFPARDVPSMVMFSVNARSASESDSAGVSCATKQIGVLVQVTNDGLAGLGKDIRETRIPCSKCDACKDAVDRSTGAPSQARCENESPFREFCTWDSQFQMCDQRDDVCPRSYGCCFAQDPYILPDGTAVPEQKRYYYGGRDENGVYDPSQVDFTYALGCVDTARSCEQDGAACPSGIHYPFYQVMRHPLSDESPDPPDTVGPRRQSDRAYWKDQCEYTESSSSSNGSATSSSSEPGAITVDYFCKNEFSWQDYVDIVAQGGLLPLKNLPIFTTQPLSDGSIFFSRAYTPVTKSSPTFAQELSVFYDNLTPATEQNKRDGPVTCEQSKTVITCCAIGGCKESVALDACLGQPVFPNGLPRNAQRKTICDLASDAGQCAPPPANWQPGLGAGT